MTVTANSQLLAGRVILITGAASGIGAAVAQCYAAHGATAILLDKQLPALEHLYDSIVASGAPTPALYPLDLKGASVPDYQDMVAAIENNFGRLDGLVHCAATLGQLAPVPQQDVKTWSETLHVNLTAPVLLTRSCLPLLERSAPAFIIFTTDSYQGKAYWGAYGISKAGLDSFAMQLADELAAEGKIRVNIVDPGRVQTPLFARAFPALDPSTLATPEMVTASYLTLSSQQDLHGQRLSAQ